MHAFSLPTQQEQYPVFDIHSYGARVIGEVQSQETGEKCSCTAQLSGYLHSVINLQVIMEVFSSVT